MPSAMPSSMPSSVPSEEPPALLSAMLPAKPSNRFIVLARKVYNPVGFSKGYNFALFFIFFGAGMGFSLSRLMYLDYANVFCGSDGASPGECFMYAKTNLREVGIRLHLFTIIPGTCLACLQFVPVIRHKFMLFHRVNGYMCVLLSVVSAVGSFIIAPVSFGGGIEIRAWIGLSTIMFIGSLFLALYNIKRLQIEEHRAWMLRAWFYSCSIITTRLIMVIAAFTMKGEFYQAMPCDKIGSFYESSSALLEAHPLCSSPDAWSPVMATMDGTEENAAAALSLAFGMATWMALSIHAIGIEVYLRLTPAEFERLRQISYKRQMEAGFKNPGRAGLTIDRVGDSARWTPDTKAVVVMERECLVG